ncbi:hypothetical protein G5C60_43980 [Streptomyces sp. HC44]|uniref:Uncharacterized protein n=1 Tax=Streptomyces scabichelini TaxID=2711217 RepID=A0A6G4VJV5_9ACTN|nr:hypothetical protein [Streptomyces scabichelini]NGO14376.1 hypothetical protein [Streptomyces scabichelini]
MTTTTQPTTVQTSGTTASQAFRDALAAVAAINMGRIPLHRNAVLYDTPGVLNAT